MPVPLSGIPLIDRAYGHLHRRALVAGSASITYQELLDRSGYIASALLGDKEDLKEARIAFLAAPGIEYVCIQWGIWRAGGIAVPLCEKHPPASMEYVLRDTAAEALVCTPEFYEILHPFEASGITNLIELAALLDSKEGGQAGTQASKGTAEGAAVGAQASKGTAEGAAVGAQAAKGATESTSRETIKGEARQLPELGPERRAMILYTSGTTGAPKGVVSTHANIDTQITALTTSWKWEAADHVLNVLPLHHVHGIVNMLCCALYSGACCEFLPKFDPQAVFTVFLKGEVNVFMAVPTIYFKLISQYQDLPEETQKACSEAMGSFRLMVSGSAALPVSVLEQWREISGHTLLERYGMTEMGMAISNPYEGERRPGYIGQPLNGVTVRLVDESNTLVPDGSPGEIQVKGNNVFSEYWQKPEETRVAFTPDGWFRTGDIAVFEDGSYRILGRNSVDIIKSGGYKISALEIEEVLRKHPEIRDCAVVGIPDLEWGEVIGAGIVADGAVPGPEALKTWLKPQLAAYKIPRKYLPLEELPRNVLGKVTKNELKSLFNSKN